MIAGIILFLGCVVSTIFPPLWAILIAYLSGLLLQGYDPLILSIIAVSGGWLGTTCLWYFDVYVERFVRWCSDVISQKLSRYNFSKLQLPAWSKKLSSRVGPGSKRVVKWLVTSLWLYNPLPDIIIIRLIRKDMPFAVFLPLAFIGKLFAYAPYIYGIQLGITFLFS